MLLAVTTSILHIVTKPPESGMMFQIKKFGTGKNMSSDQKSGHGVSIANTLVWGALALLTGGIALTAAFAAASRQGGVKETAVAAGVAVVSGLVAAATGKVARDSALDAFGKPPEEKHELPPFFSRLFDENKPKGPN